MPPLLSGAVLAGPAADTFGRRPVYLCNAAVFLLGYLVTGLSGSYSVMVVGRLLAGVGTGVAG